MTAAPLKVAVVGHTNTGKTSLLRTLMRDVTFGEVSDRPAVTRAVASALLRVGGVPVVELFDTPGLEDSIGLLEHLEASRDDRRREWIDVLLAFLDGPEAKDRFAQEAKALRQVLDSDVALYVIDARDPVLAKHRDELEILGRCARPVVPVLNFTASDAARTAAWREHLGRANMHAVAEFDTVVFDADDEQRLYEKMRTLLDGHRDVLDRLGADRRAQREALVRGSAALLAELLVDVAACRLSVPSDDPARAERAMEDLREQVRAREQACVDRLLALHRFRPDDVTGVPLPIDDGAWGHDLFSPEALKQFGLHAGGAAATGAMVGLTADLMLGGLSLGAATAAGAAIGGLFGAARTHGRRLVEKARGRTDLRVDRATLRLLAARQTRLIEALLHRGHAATGAVELLDADDGGGDGGPVGATADARVLPRPVLALLDRAAQHPQWTTLVVADAEAAPAPRLPADADRQDTVQRLADLLEPTIAA